MRIACFDLKGTLVRHDDLSRAVPLMPKLLGQLQREGWALKIVTTFGESTAAGLLQTICREADVKASDVEVLSGADRARCIQGLREANPDEEIVLIDDKPEHIAAVHRAAMPNVRVLGFLGSGKYAPLAGDLSDCIGVRYSLTAEDLAVQLGVHVLGDFADLHPLRVEDLFDMLPGLTHPLSSVGGDDRLVWTVIAHRRTAVMIIPRALRWRNLAWVRCDECVWKLMVELATIECEDVHRDAILGKDDLRAEGYVDAVAQSPPEIRQRLKELLDSGLGLMAFGIDRIGRGAARAAVSPDERPLLWVDNNLCANQERLRMIP